MKYRILDHNFRPGKYSSQFGYADVEWIDFKDSNDSSIPLVITDLFLNDHSLNQLNESNMIAWILEPQEICESMFGNPVYNWITYNHHRFSKVFTHSNKLLNLLPNAHFVTQCGTWIHESDWRIFNKTKDVSFIASNKNHTSGHKLRNELRTHIINKVDCFGRGVNDISYKIDALKEYRYSIAFENCIADTYFSEKIIDCFLTGTIPVYYGTSNIGKYFNMDGIIQVSGISEVLNILPYLTAEYYNDKKDAIESNFNIAKEYIAAEKMIAVL